MVEGGVNTIPLRGYGGFCTRISTGAPVPGADAIVMVSTPKPMAMISSSIARIPLTAYRCQGLRHKGGGSCSIQEHPFPDRWRPSLLQASPVSGSSSEPSVYVISRERGKLIGPSKHLNREGCLTPIQPGIAAALEEAGCSVIHGGIVRDDPS